METIFAADPISRLSAEQCRAAAEQQVALNAYGWGPIAEQVGFANPVLGQNIPFGINRISPSNINTPFSTHFGMLPTTGVAGTTCNHGFVNPSVISQLLHLREVQQLRELQLLRALQFSNTMGMNPWVGSHINQTPYVGNIFSGLNPLAQSNWSHPTVYGYPSHPLQNVYANTLGGYPVVPRV